MIWHTWQRAIESGAERLVIATDDPRIEQAAAGFGAEVVMTGEQHRSGTDRVAEAAAQMGLGDDAIIVNLQGDEPLMPPGLIRQAAETLFHQPDAQLATLATAVHSVGEFLDTNVVKLVIDETGRALYFSRAPIPWPRDGAGGDLLSQQSHGQALRHLGIYAYRGAACKRWRKRRSPRWKRRNAWNSSGRCGSICASRSRSPPSRWSPVSIAPRIWTGCVHSSRPRIDGRVCL